MLAFVTVGATTPFDELVEAILSVNVLKALSEKGFKHITIQAGPSKRFLDTHEERDNLVIDIWKFKPSLKEDIQTSDLVISHAGSGSILDALRLHRALIVVPNPTLMDNHQLELAEALENRRHLKSATISNLASTISQLDPFTLIPFPNFDGTKFRALLDEEMGYES